MCGYQNILKRGLYPLFLGLGVISKYLYQPDFSCVKNMLHVLKRGGAIGLFPESIQSSSGSTHPINPATTKFIKKSRANIILYKCPACKKEHCLHVEDDAILWIQSKGKRVLRLG